MLSSLPKLLLDVKSSGYLDSKSCVKSLLMCSSHSRSGSGDWTDRSKLWPVKFVLEVVISDSDEVWMCWWYEFSVFCKFGLVVESGDGGSKPIICCEIPVKYVGSIAFKASTQWSIWPWKKKNNQFITCFKLLLFRRKSLHQLKQKQYNGFVMMNKKALFVPIFARCWH